MKRKQRSCVLVNVKKQNMTKLTFGQTTLEQVDQYKYLGITFTENAQLGLAQEIIFKKGLKAYYAMLNTLYSMNQCNVRNYLACFQALVQPILMYGCEVWATEFLDQKVPKSFLSGQNHLLPSEKLEMKFMKYLLGLPRGASNIGVCCELSHMPLRTYATSQILKYYHRLKLGSQNLLVQNVFNAVCDKTINPFSKILTLLTDCKVALPTPTVRNHIRSTVQKSIECLHDRMYDRWDTEILLNRKLETFNRLKDSHDPDFYVFNIDDRHARKCIASLRLSCHHLNIEVGRYKKIAREDRICEHCNLNAIETEEHFMMSCTLYSHHRSSLYRDLHIIGNEEWFKCQSPNDKFHYLMQPRDTKTTTLVIRYIKTCMEMRKSKTYIAT